MCVLQGRGLHDNGEVAGVILLLCVIISCCDRTKMVKIGVRLRKLSQNQNRGSAFFWTTRYKSSVCWLQDADAGAQQVQILSQRFVTHSSCLTRKEKENCRKNSLYQTFQLCLNKYLKNCPFSGRCNIQHSALCSTLYSAGLDVTSPYLTIKLN